MAHSVNRNSQTGQPLGLRPSIAADNNADPHPFAGKIMHVVVACA